MTGKPSLGGGTHRENMVSLMNERKGKRTTKLMSVLNKRRSQNVDTVELAEYLHRLLAFRKCKHALFLHGFSFL
jgi:hypothetical protein